MMNNSEKEYLKSVPLLKDLTENELEEFAKILRPIKVKEGEIIVTEGEEGNTMFLFREGLVQVSTQITLKIGKGSEWLDTEKSIAAFDPSKMTFFGEMSLITGAPRSATVKALSQCLLYEIKKVDFDNLCNNFPEMGYKILRAIIYILSGRIRELNQSVLKLTTALSIIVSKNKK
ncbi:MAG: cyclic nucleotide-binding domain-containing protein [Brevinematales bacterium]|nr:cyclic nucleotide-binding domain-containing protein [Brevinematales bacterium]